MDAKRFKDLEPTEFFEFVAERKYYGMMRGPWIKISPRKYYGHGMICRVGTINALVTPMTRDEALGGAK